LRAISASRQYYLRSHYRVGAASRCPQHPGAAAADPAKTYHTAKLKLMEGKPLVGGTVSSPDPNMYCAMANAGPLAWKDRPGFTFFQGPGETSLIQSGAQVLLALP